MNIHRHSRYKRDIHITCTDTHTTHTYIQRYIKDTRTYVAYTDAHGQAKLVHEYRHTHNTLKEPHTHAKLHKYT